MTLGSPKTQIRMTGSVRVAHIYDAKNYVFRGVKKGQGKTGYGIIF